MTRRFQSTALIVSPIALWCLIWLAMQVAHGQTPAFDESIRRAIHDAANPGLTRVLEAVTLLGSQAVVISVASCAVLILFFQGRRDRALLIAIAMAGAELLLWILKVEFHRPRPEPFFGSVPPASYSFPSGHALLSFCCYGTLSAVCSPRRWVRIAAAALILSVGISRVYLGVHYPSDVIAGYLVAILWMASVAVAYRRLASVDR